MQPPLVVDLDGTLVQTDTLVEGMARACKANPFHAFNILLWLFSGIAKLKEKLAALSPTDASHLPYRADFVEYLRQEKAKGRELILATAAHRTIATAVARHLDLFSRVFATENGTNLKGRAKLACLHQAGIHDFVYAGDSLADWPLWTSAHAAVLVGVGPVLSRRVHQRVSVERAFPQTPANLSVWLRLLRWHQWSKNTLLFVPLLTSFAFDDANKLITALLGFLSFSLCASATYIFNDLWDLDNDRQHPRKKSRPLASGQISIQAGVVCALALLVSGFLLATQVGMAFCAALGIYLLLTASYSFYFKARMALDVLVLSMLYTLRILAGSLATDIAISRWLLAFAAFSFLGLALVKRCAELMHKRGTHPQERLPGRGYMAQDIEVLYPFGIASSLVSVVVFCLFITAPETSLRYGSPHLLWLAAIGLVYLHMRLWLKTVRGEMDDDPIVHMLNNQSSLATAAVIVLIMLVAHLSART